jgi:hypothetical protein
VEGIVVGDDSLPVPLAPGLWYLAVYNPGTIPVSYWVEAVESDAPVLTPTIQLTNEVAYQGSVTGTNLAQFQVYVPPGTLFATNTVINLNGTGVLTTRQSPPPETGSTILIFWRRRRRKPR